MGAGGAVEGRFVYRRAREAHTLRALGCCGHASDGGAGYVVLETQTCAATVSDGDHSPRRHDTPAGGVWSTRFVTRRPPTGFHGDGARWKEPALATCARFGKDVSNSGHRGRGPLPILVSR